MQPIYVEEKNDKVKIIRNPASLYTCVVGYPSILNLALKQTTTQSSVSNNDEYLYGSSYAVDGRYVVNNFCAFTNSGTSLWFWFSIYKKKIKGKGKFINKKNKKLK